MTEIRILATGADFLIENVGNIGSSVEQIMSEAQKEIHILAYVISKHADKFMNILERSLESGVKVTLVINRLAEQDEKIKSQLFSWSKIFPYFKLVNFDRKGKILHAKVVVADRDKAVIGSANFSWGGLSANYEIGVLVRGKDAWMLSKMADNIISKN